MKAGVYRITCVPTKRSYIGESIQMGIRWKTGHVRQLNAGRHSNSRLQRAWDKYGCAAFEFSVVWRVPDDVAEELSKSRVSEVTKMMEARIGSAMLDEGFDLFNIAPFDHWGKSNPSFSPDVRAKQSASATRRFSDKTERTKQSSALVLALSTPEARKRASDAARKRVTPEFRKLMSEKARDQWRSEEFRSNFHEKTSGDKNHSARRVRCVDTGEVFQTTTAAGASVGVSQGHIAGSIYSGKRCKGKRFEYLDPPTRTRKK